MVFDVKKTVDYWLTGAKYDLGVADAMFKTRKYPYALFMGHLALEKLLKALFVKEHKETSPLTHNLPFLAEKLSFEFPVDIEKKLIHFMKFHFEARYPEREKKFYKICTRKYTEKNLNDIILVYKWLKKELLKK